MSWNNQSNWVYEDPSADLSLENIFPLSRRAVSLYARNKSNPKIREGFLHISGAINMMDGMEYHFANFNQVHSKLYKGNDIQEIAQAYQYEKDQIHKIKHEIIAYINRVGQFYHFADSDFVKSRLQDVNSCMPIIKKLTKFRNKYTAHRSLDKPYKDDDGREIYHEVSFGQSIIRNADGNLVFKITTAEGDFDFDPEREHGIIMRESYCIIELLTQSV